MGTRDTTRFADERKGSVLDLGFEIESKGNKAKGDDGEAVVGYE
jgi:hypothetical protein